MNDLSTNEKGFKTPYLSALGAFALAFGCAVGWGSFVMPGTTFLPIAGPAGAALGLGLGALIMMILAVSYHYLGNKYPDCGGTYTFTKKLFGYDHGFLSAWFLIITYIAIIWANATALPLIAHTLLGDTFHFGFHYQIAGYDVWFGEILLDLGALVLGALVCLRRKLSETSQIIAAILLFGGIVVCFVAAAIAKKGSGVIFEPAFSPDNSPFNGTLTIFILAPWAFVGFESISHSAGEAKYSQKRVFLIMFLALAAAGIAYAFLALLAAAALPEGVNSWTEYVSNLGNYSGVQSQPTFFAAREALGTAGTVILGVAALCGIFTGLIGNYVALSRLVRSMSEDGLFSGWLGKLNKNEVPRNAIFCILGVSVIFPFLGRTAIGWIVDVTTVGATIAYAFTSASAFRSARREKNVKYMVFGGLGIIISLIFALAFLVPNLLSITTLSAESYLILAAWGILGFLVFLVMLKRDRQRRLGRSTVAWIVLLGLIIFTSSIWMRQTIDRSIERSIEPIQEYYTGKLEEAGVDIVSGATKTNYQYLSDELDKIETSILKATMIQVGLIVGSLIIMFIIYARIQKREREIEIEKAIAEDSSRAKTSFLSNMSHEIRTPMNAIIGLDNIALRDPDLNPRTREQLEKIGSSAKHLLGLINDILDMSRIESGRMVLKDEEFSFREFIDQINIIINGQCQDKGLHYECQIAGKVNDYYFGDDMKLKQVIINILGNSVKFTPAPGLVTLTVEQLSANETESVMRFKMRDTGIGMDREFIPKIFEAFSQEDATTTNRYGGSGLGMAITKNFVDMMNGTIEVDSVKGVGSVFTVTVTLKNSARAFKPDITLPEGLRVAVVDDDEIACEHAGYVLEALGISADVFTAASNALDAIRAAFEGGIPYGLILTDYRMPGIDGVELVRNVRAFDSGKTPVIMLTGYNVDDVEEEARSGLIDGILAKPLFSDSLMRTISSVLERRLEGNSRAPGGKIVTEEEMFESLLSGHRALIAEDVDANAEILADLLDLEDMVSERAENGQIALQMFSERPAGYYDIILMDVRMPVMDGLTATESIRALDRPDAKSIPIIAMTANVFDEDVERSLKAGMNAHLSKPIEPELLYQTMAKYFSVES